SRRTPPRARPRRSSSRAGTRKPRRSCRVPRTTPSWYPCAMVRRVAACILCVLACGDPAGSRDETVLRVSASAGLAPLDPSTGRAGSTAAALDLIYVPTSEHLRAPSQDGAMVRFQRRPQSGHSAQELVDALRGEGLVSAKAVGEELVEARFRDELAAIASLQDWKTLLALGPFAVEQESEGDRKST